jgi:uncharacterized membrane protein
MTPATLFGPDTWPLAAAAAFWIALHLGVAGTALRGKLIGMLGPGGYRGLFTILSFLGLAGLILGWRSAPEAPIWAAAPAAAWVTLVLMLPAMILFVGSVTDANPAAVGGERLLDREGLARGIFRVTRHPMLWAFSIWAACHLAMRGSDAGILFFGAILVTALAGMRSIDRKRADARPCEWAAYAAVTSIIPFAAILDGRNRLAWREIAGWRLLAGIAAWGILLVLHPLLLGVPALPG